MVAEITENKQEKQEKKKKQKILKTQQKQSKKQDQQTPMLREFQQAVQQRIDELYLLANQAKKREADLQETCINLAEATDGILEKISISQQHINESLSNVQTMADSVKAASIKAQKDLQVSETRIRFSVRVSVIAIMITLLCIIISIAVGIHYDNNVSTAQSVYDGLISRIKVTPVIQYNNGQAYVRIKSDSEVNLVGSDGTTSRFAEMDSIIH